eukprot:Anaeramoba_ignava/c17096_g1_i1.p7 GENE.c17096_g1_i1~~c17096_g1_i1.p7  ORF type:complete len:128 (-),score=9.11 c17096_g1_i1:3876-4259(-)
MANNVVIDTGDPRSVTGHIISGTLAAGAVAGALNYNRYTKGEISKSAAVNNSLKLSAQGGIATGSAIAAANYLGQNNIFGMLTAVSVGAMGIYAVEKISEKIEEKTLLKDKQEELLEESGEQADADK